MDIAYVPTVYTDDLLLRVGERFELWRDYQHLLYRLHGAVAENVQQADFYKLLEDPNELSVFVVKGGQIVSMAQASLSKAPPQRRAYINNVVTHDDHEGCGHGRRVMERLQEAAKMRWSPTEPLEFCLTNSPRRRNATFYRKLGFVPRVDDRIVVRIVKLVLDRIGIIAQHETVVWKQII